MTRREQITLLEERFHDVKKKLKVLLLPIIRYAKFRERNFFLRGVEL